MSESLLNSRTHTFYHWNELPFLIFHFYSISTSLFHFFHSPNEYFQLQTFCLEYMYSVFVMYSIFSLQQCHCQLALLKHIELIRRYWTLNASILKFFLHLVKGDSYLPELHYKTKEGSIVTLILKKLDWSLFLDF